MKPRAVLDTNTLISGLFFGSGNEARLVDAALKGRVKLLTSLEILEEFREVLSRPKFQLSPEEAGSAFQLVVSVSEIILAPAGAKAMCRDPDDQKFLDCASAGRADFLVTGDRDLLTMRRVGRARIVRTTELVKMIKPGR